MRNFLVKLLFFSLGIGCIIFCWNHFAPEKFYVKDAWLAFVFFIAATFFVHRRMIEAGKKRPGVLVRDFMAVTVIKFFVYLLILVAYCLLNPENAVRFTAAFLLLYFIFSAFEVSALLRHFKE